MGTGEYGNTHLIQHPGAKLCLLPLPGADGFDSLLLQILYSCGQPCDSRHVQRSGLRPLRGIARHILCRGFTAGSPIEQRPGQLRTQQQSCSLGAKQALMTGHGDEIRPQPFQRHGQCAG